MFKRIISILRANVFGQLCTLIIQFLGVPIFLHSWGKEIYGEWLVLIAIPAYLTITGTGVGFVTGNKMQMLIASNKLKEASSIFQSAWVLLLGLSTLFICIIFPIVTFLPISDWLNINHLNKGDVNLAFIILCAYMLLSLQTDLFLAVYRASGKFARGITAMNLLRLLEFAGIIVVVLLGSEIIAASLAYLVIRLAGVICMMFDLRKLSRVSLGYKLASLSEIRAEIIPILTYLAIPLTQAFIIQGLVTVIGIRLGPTAVVTFTLSRTLINLIRQFASTIHNAILPEFSDSISNGKLDLARSLHRYAFQVTLWFVVISSALLYSFSHWIFLVWTNGKVEYNNIFFLLMLVATIPFTLSAVSSYVTSSINKFNRQALVGIINAILCTLGTYFAAPYFGLFSVPVILFISELIMLSVILNQSLKIVKDPLEAFLIYNFSTFPFKELNRVVPSSNKL